MLTQVIVAHLIVTVVGFVAGFWFSDGKPGLSKMEYRIASLLGFLILGIQFLIDNSNADKAFHLLIAGAILYFGIHYGEKVRLMVEKKIFQSVRLDESRYTVWSFAKNLQAFIEESQNNPSALQQFKNDFLANYQSIVNVLNSIETFGTFIKDQELVALVQKIEGVLTKFHDFVTDESFNIDDLKELKEMVVELRDVLEGLLDFIQVRFNKYREEIIGLGMYFLKAGKNN